MSSLPQSRSAVLDWLHVAPLTAGWMIATIALPAAVFGWWWPHWSTIAHEMGHALTTMLLGGRVSGIRLHANTSGDTRTRVRWLPHLASLTMGYAAPPLLSWGLTVLYENHLAGGAVVGLTAIFLLALLLLRSAFGLLTIGSALIVLAGAIVASPAVRAGVIVAFVAIFAAGGARGIWMGWQVRSERDSIRPDGSESDAAQLRRILKITPQWFWLTAWSGLWVLCVFTSVRLLAS